ncbi:MAG: Cytochrome c biogenesis protein CcsA [Calditrichaeota bacterium]|nr:Cytochrome c biogenesis protein CcsA [Calditrichota bacterium]
MRRRLISCALAVTLPLLVLAPARAKLPANAAEYLAGIAIQSGGRVRTFDAFARDVVHEITGEHRWDNEQPLETVVRWVSNPQAAYSERVFQLVFEPLRAEMGLSATDPTRFSMEFLVGNERLVEHAEQVQAAQQAGRELTALQGKVSGLFNRISTLHGVLTGGSLALLPPEQGGTEWLSINAVSGDSTQPAATVALAWTGLLEAYKRDNVEMEVTSAKLLARELAAWHGDGVDRARLDAELFYRKADPWTIAKGLYVAAILFAIAATFVRRGWTDRLPRYTLLLGFLVHTAGLALRWYIAQRAPWSNMYESLTTAGWGVVLFGLFKYRGAGAKIAAPAAAFVGFTSLFIAAHRSLDPGIDPLVPALQSYWLNIHVIIVLLGYASATLAAVVGHVWLANDTFRPGAKRVLNGMYNVIYRLIQFTVLFLIVGILLGSVWAHSAWGRYWGWDPKETWALITWIYYLSLIHAGYAGWLRERGMAVAATAGFLLVLMTYYGVNYFLSGLHTYASGNAVQIPAAVIVFVALEVLILLGYGFGRYVRARNDRAEQTAAV